MTDVTNIRTSPLAKSSPSKKPGSTASMAASSETRSGRLLSDRLIRASSATDGVAKSSPPGVPKLTPNDLGVVPQGQGNTNACGTTSLAMLLSYWGKLTDHFKIDRSIRRMDMPTSPDDIVRYAESQGMRASMKSDASLSDLASMIDQGVPVQVLMDPLFGSGKTEFDPSDSTLHYVTVTGYERGPDGKIANLVISDPGGSGSHYKVDAREFEEAWSNLRLLGAETGLNRVMVAMVPNDDRVIEGTDGKRRRASDIRLPGNGLLGDVFSPSKPGRVTMQGLANVTNGWKGGDLGSILGGVVQLVGGGIASLPAAGAKALVKALGGSPKLADAIGRGVGRVMAPVASAVEAVGNGVKAVGNAVSNGAKAVGRFFKGLF